MAKFTTGKSVNIGDDPYRLFGEPGTVFRIPDALKDAFEQASSLNREPLG